MNQAQLQNLQALLQAQAQQTTQSLLEFRAGICTQSGTTVTADKRKGKVVVVQGDDGLLHLQWKLRPEDSTEIDLMLLPRGSTFERVPECTTGRVYLLQFKASTARKFFWLQEPKEDKDEELCKKMNDLIDNPPPAQGMGGQFGGDFDQAQLLSMLGGGGFGGMGGGGAANRRPATSPAVTSSARAAASTPAAATTPAAAGATASAAAPAATPGSGTNPQAAALAASLTAMAQQIQAQQSQVALTDVLDTDRVVAALDEDMKQQLLQHLPPSQQTMQGLNDSLRSAPLRQTLRRISSILNSEQYAALMASLGLPATGAPGVEAFLDAVEDEAKKEADKK